MRCTRTLRLDLSLGTMFSMLKDTVELQAMDWAFITGNRSQPKIKIMMKEKNHVLRCIRGPGGIMPAIQLISMACTTMVHTNHMPME